MADNQLWWNAIKVDVLCVNYKSSDMFYNDYNYYKFE
jgi:hypothetical protein